MPVTSRLAIVCCALALAGGAASAAGGGSEVHLGVTLAGRQLDRSFWDPLDSQFAWGGMVDFGPRSWPIRPALGLSGSAGSQKFANSVVDDSEALLTEVSAGFVKVWTSRGRARGYVGAGASALRASVRSDSIVLGSTSDHDDTFGWYAEGGASWRLASHFGLGVHARVLRGTSLTLFDREGNADYWQFGPVLAWHWPPARP